MNEDEVIYLDKSVWQAHINGWEITDCAVRDWHIVYLCLRKQLTSSEKRKHEETGGSYVPTQMFVMNLTKPGTSFGAQQLTGYNKPIIGVARKPVPQGLLMDESTYSTQVSVIGGGKPYPEEYITSNPMFERIKCINGYAYAVGSERKLYKRTGIGQWERVKGLPEISGSIWDYGFEDMDAFNENDMYAVGGPGDVWHFDGHQWNIQRFPNKSRLYTVTCGADGWVYISSAYARLWRGKKSKWELVFDGREETTIPHFWNDAVWFDGKLWLCANDKTQIWDGEQMSLPANNDEVLQIGGAMDAYTGDTGGLLTIASQDTVMAYDGKDWRTLVAPYRQRGVFNKIVNKVCGK